VPKTPRLREWRERAALSQGELAERSGTSRATIADLEAGNRRGQPKTVRRLSEALGIEPEDLYGREYPKEEAPPSPQLTLNGLLEEERREATYRAWLEFVNRYAERWERRIETGTFDMGSVNEFIATLEDLGPTLNRLGLQEKWEQPEESQDFSYGPIMDEAIGRLMDLLNPLIEAGVSKFDNSELEQFRRKRAELDKQFAEAG
jgi:transcriptional regulator with XRE-family HTH domain